MTISILVLAFRCVIGSCSPDLDIPKQSDARGVVSILMTNTRIRKFFPASTTRIAHVAVFLAHCSNNSSFNRKQREIACGWASARDPFLPNVNMLLSWCRCCRFVDDFSSFSARHQSDWLVLFFFLASISIFTPRHSPLVEVLDSFVHESGSTLIGVHRCWLGRHLTSVQCVTRTFLRISLCNVVSRTKLMSFSLRISSGDKCDCRRLVKHILSLRFTHSLE